MSIILVRFESMTVYHWISRGKVWRLCKVVSPSSLVFRCHTSLNSQVTSVKPPFSMTALASNVFWDAKECFLVLQIHLGCYSLSQPGGLMAFCCIRIDQSCGTSWVSDRYFLALSQLGWLLYTDYFYPLPPACFSRLVLLSLLTCAAVYLYSSAQLTLLAWP